MTETRDKTMLATVELSDGGLLELRYTPARQPNQEPKQVDLTDLAELVRRELEERSRVRVPLDVARHGIAGKDTAIQSLLKMIDKVAPTQATVLVTGENGT